jgi:hypothetical protein
LIFFDLPYGKKVEHWDQRAFTDLEMEQMLQQIVAINGSQNSVLVFVLDIEDFGRYAKVVRANGWGYIHKMTWYKPMHNATGVGCYIYATEVIMVCYRPNQHATQWFGKEKNPTKRHDIFALPACTTKIMHTDHREVNKHQKPTGLIRFFIEKHCGPSDFVLVLGFGSGSEIIGAVQSNVNVVGVEQDPRQFNAFRARLLSYKKETAELATFVKGEDISVDMDGDDVLPPANVSPSAPAVPASPADDSAAATVAADPNSCTSSGSSAGSPPAAPASPIPEVFPTTDQGEKVSCVKCTKSILKETASECLTDARVTCTDCSIVGLAPGSKVPVMFCSVVCRDALDYASLPY